MNGPTIPMSIAFVMIGLVFIARSQIGAAVAHAIRVNATDADEEGLQQLQQEMGEMKRELDSVRHELLETQERLDFTERLLATSREPDMRLKP
jgi:septal ring factor EnvC (AmiA/AmiB activator)